MHFRNAAHYLVCRTAGLAIALLATFASAPSMAQRESQMRQALGQELREVAFDNVQLGPRARCAPWLRAWDIDIGCRRFDVVYRGVYLSGLLLEHVGRTEQLTIYHLGHEAPNISVADLQEIGNEVLGTPDAAGFVKALFNQPSDVLILYMPGTGFEPLAEAETIQRTHLALGNHSTFSMLDRPGDSAAAYFVAHVKAFLNRYASSYRSVVMVGRSGGGWATTLAAAAETRIRCSISFFGTLPLRLRLPAPDDRQNDLGDFEQHGLYLYKRLDYTDLYALATSGNRTHVQVYNERDNCCFSGHVKGAAVMRYVLGQYPALKNFHTEILPVRSEFDHFNLDAPAIAQVNKHCPVR